MTRFRARLMAGLVRIRIRRRQYRLPPLMTLQGKANSWMSNISVFVDAAPGRGLKRIQPRLGASTVVVDGFTSLVLNQSDS